jgi:hypothetical protein
LGEEEEEQEEERLYLLSGLAAGCRLLAMHALPRV